jgi:hypothetical protein
MYTIAAFNFCHICFDVEVYIDSNIYIGGKSPKWTFTGNLILPMGIGKIRLPRVPNDKEEKWEAIIRNMKITIEI